MFIISLRTCKLWAAENINWSWLRFPTCKGWTHTYPKVLPLSEDSMSFWAAWTWSKHTMRMNFKHADAETDVSHIYIVIYIELYIYNYVYIYNIYIYIYICVFTLYCLWSLPLTGLMCSSSICRFGMGVQQGIVAFFQISTKCEHKQRKTKWTWWVLHEGQVWANKRCTISTSPAKKNIKVGECRKYREQDLVTNSEG